MEIKNKRKIVRSTTAQIRILVDYMAANPLFAAGEYRGPLGSEKLEKEWEALQRELCNHGPQKSVDQWKHTWRDLKKKARDEGSKVRQALNATGNKIEVPKMNQQTEKFLDIIGHECSTGIENTPGETGLGPMVIDTNIPLPESEVELGPTGQILEQRSIPGPSTEAQGPSRQRQTTPGPSGPKRKQFQTENKFDKITKAYEKNNEILEEIRKELKQSNRYRVGQLKLLQEISNKLNRSPSPQHNEEHQ